ncbi:hypothetical protein QR680_004522 [Steinernema hermaphroditum]|uniref:Aldehyde dehydrogenase n=1 Tax=Steinernema hermaphroditum TaxID=289476 RepID=A0AA39HR95_9BILA|nr:hypothetical protein QR680_004522 [Steinernema hermaphroditum]
MAFHELIKIQRDFFGSGVTKDPGHRKKTLLTLKKAILENREVLCEGVFSDLRRQPKATYIMEISNALVEIDYMVQNLDEWSAPQMVEKTFLTALDTPMIVKDPKGVVLLIAPWNYPLSMVLLPMVNILAAGNTVIVKPSELASHTAEALDLVFKKYFEKRLVAVVRGGVPETTELLGERFDHIVYTGNPRVAKIVMRAAARHLTPVTLELGGKSPVVVEDDADVELSARRVAWGKWLNCGQTCLAPDYVLISSAIKSRFVDALRKAIFEFFGNDVQKSADYSRIVNRCHFDRLHDLLAKSKAPVLFRGGECSRDDLFVPPVILDALRDDVFMEDEIFGPVLPILSSENLSESIAFINRGEKPLAAYIFTRSEASVNSFCRETSSGGVTVNDVLMHMTVDTLPFGGVGASGMGRYRGKFGFDAFTHEKAVLKRGFFGEALLAARYPPLNDSKYVQITSLTSSRHGFPKSLKNLFSSMPLILLGILIGLFFHKYASN